MNPELLRCIQRLFEHHARKIRNLAARGVVSLVRDGLKMQDCQLKLLAGEVIESAEHPQNYGFTSHPHPEAEAFVVFVNGAREHPVILAVDDRRFRVKGLAQGEVCIYTDEGDTITLKRGNRVEVKTRHAVVDASESCAVTTKAYSVECETWSVKAQTATLEAEIAAGITVQNGAASVTAPVITLAGALMLQPAPGAPTAGMSSSAPIAINAPEVSINE